MKRFAPTLGQAFALGLFGMLLLLGVLFSLVFDGSRRSILQSSDRLRDESGRQIAARVSDFLAQANTPIKFLEDQISHGLLKARDLKAIENALYVQILANEQLSEATFTYGRALGFDKEGEMRLAPEGRGQVSVYRENGEIRRRHVTQEGRLFVTDHPSAGSQGKKVPDPTSHLTFVTLAGKARYGRALWSDLHWTEIDAAMPEEQRRVVVSVQKAIEEGGAAGGGTRKASRPQGSADADPRQFAGVVRVAISAAQIDGIEKLKLLGSRQDDPHTVFICDSQRRLITRSSPQDRLGEVDDDLRVISEQGSPLINAALKVGGLENVSRENPTLSGRFLVDQRAYLVSYRALESSQDWIVGVVAPEDYYLGELVRTRDRLLLASLLVMGVMGLGAALLLRSIRKAQNQIVHETERMNHFEFKPAQSRSIFADVQASLESLEKAKAAMRAMGKYVPIELVRQLYLEKSEPSLGGEIADVSIMFTDVIEFTSISERLKPDALAAALGRYLEIMAGIIQDKHRGTIDKFIGDAIMTLWNAPSPVSDHPDVACRAALACLRANRELCLSQEWRGLPHFGTRFGLHRDRVLIGHFGAPNRINYTAIGDGVNLASRLEGLNKLFGTSILVSESIHEGAQSDLAFRLLDRVAVKGKLQGVGVYELVGFRAELGDERGRVLKDYERAFAAYQKRDFIGAEKIFESHPSDPPSRVLASRCREFCASAPPPDWNGVYIATEK